MHTMEDVKRVYGEGRISTRGLVGAAWRDRRGRMIRTIRGGITGVAMTDYLEAALLNEVLRNTNFAAIGTIYVGLTTAQATPEAGTVTEVTTSGTAYARQAVTFAAPDSTSTCFNSAQITYAVATANYGTVTGFGYWDAVTAGNLVLYGTLAAGQVINTGNQFIFGANALSVQFD